jgi:3-deoxy-7-phosphoheptulonate synthase
MPFVAPMARAALAAGADGIMVEMHPWPEQALCDKEQALPPEGFAALMADLTRMAAALGVPMR